MIDSLLVNIPPLTLEGQAAAGRILPLMASTGCELTLTEVAPTQFTASYLAPGMPVPLAVVGVSMADCLTQLADRLVPLPPVTPEEAPA